MVAVKFWGDILSSTNLTATIQRGLAQGWQSSLSDKATISDFAGAVEAADPLGLYVFKLLARVIGVVCCNLVYAFNPKVLVLSGPLFRQMPQLSDDVRTHLNNGMLRTPIEAVELKTSTLGEDGVTIGGAALVLDHLFRTHKGSEGK